MEILGASLVLICMLLLYDFVGVMIQSKFKTLNAISSFILGTCATAAVLMVLVVPLVLFNSPWIPLVLAVFGGMLGVFLVALVYKIKNNVGYFKTWNKQKLTLLGISILVFLLLSGITANIYTEWGDGAYWLSLFNDIANNHTINMMNPNTGMAVPFFDPHFLSVHYIWVAVIGSVTNIPTVLIATITLTVLNIHFFTSIIYDAVNLLVKKLNFWIKTFITLAVFGSLILISTHFQIALVPWMGNGFTLGLVIASFVVLYIVLYNDMPNYLQYVIMIAFSLASFYYASTVFFLVGGYYGLAIIWDIILHRKLRWNRILPILVGMVCFVALMALVIFKQATVNAGTILDIVATEQNAISNGTLNISGILASWSRYLKTIFIFRYPVAIVACIYACVHWRKIVQYKAIVFLGWLVISHWVLQAPIFENIISKYITTGLLYDRFLAINITVEFLLLFTLIVLVLKEFGAKTFWQVIMVIIIAGTLIYPGIGEKFLLAPGTFRDLQHITYRPFNFYIYSEEKRALAEALALDEERHVTAAPKDTLHTVIRSLDPNGEMLIHRDTITGTENDEPIKWNLTNTDKAIDAKQLNYCLDDGYYEPLCDELVEEIIKRQNVDYLVIYANSKIEAKLMQDYPIYYQDETYIVFDVSHD